jgi:hypothetical protein
MTLKEEVDKIIKDSNHDEEYKTDKIFYMIQKRIDNELRKDRPADLYRAYNAALDDVNDMLK